MNIEDEIMEIANKYMIYLDEDYNIQPVIHKDDLIDFVKEVLETFEVLYK